MTVSAKSANGSIEFVGNGVVITTRGASKTIPLDRVQGVEFKPAGMLAGFIRVSVAGSAEVAVHSKAKNEAIQKDPNAVLFSRAKLNPDFKAVADAINGALLG